MTTSLLFGRHWLLVACALGCASPARDTNDAHGSGSHDAGELVAVHGEFLADGSCRALVNGASLFTGGDAARASYETGAVADIAPAGYALQQLACMRAATDPALPNDGDERMVIVTLYVREGESLRAGRYVVRAGLADAGDTAGDTAGVATRTAIAIFGARTTPGRESAHAGVRYLEARDGTLDITAVDGTRVRGSFDVRAGEAWSM